MNCAFFQGLGPMGLLAPFILPTLTGTSTPCPAYSSLRSERGARQPRAGRVPPPRRLPEVAPPLSGFLPDFNPKGSSASRTARSRPFPGEAASTRAVTPRASGAAHRTRGRPPAPERPWKWPGWAGGASAWGPATTATRRGASKGTKPPPGPAATAAAATTAARSSSASPRGWSRTPRPRRARTRPRGRTSRRGPAPRPRAPPRWRRRWRARPRPRRRRRRAGSAGARARRTRPP